MDQKSYCTQQKSLLLKMSYIKNLYYIQLDSKCRLKSEDTDILLQKPIDVVHIFHLCTAFFQEHYIGSSYT